MGSFWTGVCNMWMHCNDQIIKIKNSVLKRLHYSYVANPVSAMEKKVIDSFQMGTRELKKNGTFFVDRNCFETGKKMSRVNLQ